MALVNDYSVINQSGGLPVNQVPTNQYQPPVSFSHIIIYRKWGSGVVALTLSYKELQNYSHLRDNRVKEDGDDNGKISRNDVVLNLHIYKDSPRDRDPWPGDYRPESRPTRYFQWAQRSSIK